MPHRIPNAQTLRLLILLAALVPAREADAYRLLFYDWAESGMTAFGQTVAAVGDVDGNGMEDFVVGDRGFDGGGTNTGRAYLYLPTLDGEIPEPLILVNAQSAGMFGKEISAAGDMNNDGYADFTITSENIRAVHLFLGAADPGAIERVVLPSPADERSLSAVGIGDVDGDGFDDLLVGVFQSEDALLYLGGDPVATVPDIILTGDDTSFGTDIAPLGDYDGDGFADFAVGSPYQVVDGVMRGAVHVYRGGAALAQDPIVLFGSQPYEGYGHSLELAGDLDGVGGQELLIGARDRLDVLKLDPDAGPWLASSIHGEFASFTGRTDVDEDGLPDIVLTSWDPRQTSAFSGKGVLMLQTLALSAASWRTDHGGFDITSLADLDGDGFREILLGTNETTHGFGGDVRILAGGEPVVPRFRVGDVYTVTSEEVEVPVFVELASGGADADLPLASVDMALTYDPDVATYLGAVAPASTASWLLAARSGAGWVRISMAASTAAEVHPEPSPLVTLRFAAGAETGRSLLTIEEIEAHAGVEHPLWPTVESGRLVVTSATATPPTAESPWIRARPNPCNPRTTISWLGAATGPVEIGIFDARGRHVWGRRLSAEEAAAGSVTWRGVDRGGRTVASGTYLLKARGDRWSARSRLTVAR